MELNREREYKIGMDFLATPFVFEMLSEAEARIPGKEARVCWMRDIMRLNVPGVDEKEVSKETPR